MLGTSSLYRIQGIHWGSQHLRHVDVRRDESVPVYKYLCAANQDSRISFNCVNEQSRWISLQWLALRSARLNSALSQFRAVMGFVLSFCLALGSLSALLSTIYICIYMLIHTCVSERYHYLMALRKLNELNASGRTSGFLNCTEGRPISIRLGSAWYRTQAS